jgi:hypothetical protein
MVEIGNLGVILGNCFVSQPVGSKADGQERKQPARFYRKEPRDHKENGNVKLCEHAGF